MKNIRASRWTQWCSLCRVLLPVVCVVLLPGAVASTLWQKPIFTDEELRWIDAHPIVHIAVEANWSPIEYVRNGKHAGLVAGYLNAVSKMTGLTFDTVPGTEWGRAYDALATGKVDLLPGVWRELVSDRVGSDALVSTPYMGGRLTAVTRDNSAMVFSLKRLEGRRVAIKGRGAIEYFTRHSGVALDVLTFDTEELALAAVANGEADAALGIDFTILPIVRRQFPGQLYMSGMLADRPVSLAMLTRADLPILASIIDKSLAAIPVSESAAITRDWVELGDNGKPTLRSILHDRAPQVVAIAATLLIFALFAYLYWKSRAAAIRSKLDKAMVLAFVSHEIRTPMQTVLSSLDFLRRSHLPPRQADRADAAVSASETLLALLDDILEYSRLESSKVTFAAQAVELESWARETVDMVRWRAESKGISMTLDIEIPPALHVEIDPVRVRQIVLNLLVNAINFTDDGTVTLRVRISATRRRRNRTLLLEVGHTGVGIAADQFKHLFDAYWQDDRASRSGGVGSGLGLAICRKLVELMRGTITVSSTPRVETVFSVKLPVAVTDNASSAQSTAWAPVSPPASAAQSCRKVPYILIVDDNEAVRDSLQDQCEALGCVGIIADSGEAALQQLARTHVDMVLLDCNLPDVDGCALVRAIRQRESARKGRYVPIIVISANTGDAHKVRCFESGMDGVLGKPLRLEALRQMIAMWCPAYAGVAPDQAAAT